MKKTAKKLNESPACKGCGERHGFVYDQVYREDVCKACRWPRGPGRRALAPVEPKKVIMSEGERIKLLETQVAALTAQVNHLTNCASANAKMLNDWTPLVQNDLKVLFDNVNTLREHAQVHTLPPLMVIRGQ